MDVTKETTEQIQSPQDGSELLYSSVALAQERQNKKQPKLEKELTSFDIE